MFRAMFSPIIRSAGLYFQLLLMLTNIVTAGVTDEMELNGTFNSISSVTPAGSDIG
jgi:hypothetical protein